VKIVEKRKKCGLPSKLHKRVGEARKSIKRHALPDFISTIASRFVHFSPPPNTFHSNRRKFAVTP